MILMKSLRVYELHLKRICLALSKKVSRLVLARNLKFQIGAISVAQLKGKVVSIRACATPELLEVAEVSSDDGLGCIDDLEYFGFSEATACLCEKDC